MHWWMCSARPAASPTSSRPRCRCTKASTPYSQNRWPSLRFDVLSLNDRLSRFLPAGFYYKTFMYATLGLGASLRAAHPPRSRTRAARGDRGGACGTGRDRAWPRRRTRHRRRSRRPCGRTPPGRIAARACCSWSRTWCSAARRFSMNAGQPGARKCAQRSPPSATCAASRPPRCWAPMVTGCSARCETLAAEEAHRFGGLRERLHVIRAERVLIATGALERLDRLPR